MKNVFIFFCRLPLNTMGVCVNTSQTSVFEQVAYNKCRERNLEALFLHHTTRFEGSEDVLRFLCLLPSIIVSAFGFWYICQSMNNTFIREKRKSRLTAWALFLSFPVIIGLLQVLDLFENVQEIVCDINILETCTCAIHVDYLQIVHTLTRIIVSWKYSGLILYLVLSCAPSLCVLYYPSKWYLPVSAFLICSYAFAIASNVSASTCQLRLPPEFASEGTCLSNDPINPEACNQDCKVLECGSINDETNCEDCPIDFACNALTLQTPIEICIPCSVILKSVNQLLCSFPFHNLSLYFSILALLPIIFVQSMTASENMAFAIRIDPLYRKDTVREWENSS